MRYALITAASVLAVAGHTAIAQTATTNNDANPRQAATTSAASPTATGARSAEAGAPAIARASRLIGRNIENRDGDDIGEIKDMVLDPKTGQVQQVVVGVGGFLGIGEKDVALKWDQLQIQQEVRTVTAPAPGAPGTAMAPRTDTAPPAAGATSTPAQTPRASATPPAAGTASADGTAVRTGEPRVVVNMTKEQLQDAPEFRFEEDRAAMSGAVPARSQAAPAGNSPAAQTGADAKAGSLAQEDREFVQKAAMGGMAEVSLGQLALSKAASDQVKQFGQRMVDDHGKANRELTAIAKSKGLTPPANLDEKHKAVMTKLQGLSGAEFDREYMTAMVADHKETIALFEKAADSGKDAELKAFARKTLPILEEHLKMAQSTQEAMTGARSGGVAKRGS